MLNTPPPTTTHNYAKHVVTLISIFSENYADQFQEVG